MIGDILANFSFLAQWNAGILLVVLLGIVFYLFLLPTSKEHTVSKTVIFIIGMALFYIALGSPLNILGRIIFRAHIAQMIILFLFVVPLLLVGMKTEIISKLVSYSTFRKGYNIFTNPIVAIVLFHGMFIIYHIPGVFDYVRMSYSLNYLYVLTMFVTALLVWSPIFPIDYQRNRLSYRNKFFYGLWNMVLFLPIELVLLFMNNNLYIIYMDFDLLLTALSVCLPAGDSIQTLPSDFLETLLPFPPIEEQKNGGVMLLGSQLLWLILPMIFKRQYTNL
ncbi:cytochrome c oxidase assembly protein [Aquibacillus rhizosphaerae]|uniref:Cytochrome c oxidase assembly protein n=1 Tax=Aquibacillus rhizosphaerae TaxID=3051431 RepID=A0ABT7LB86_9BACI|nr:cytochrome c oxidase assembly protein [Aquibacillus sp. LR5S19]MDL4843122.1 cytochrome c oxidase assembly protein [Aquibacillus sp. LR5S19]